MKMKIGLQLFRILFILSIAYFFPAYVSAGESFIGTDTLVYKPYKDTVGLTKAQVYNHKSSETLLIYKPRPFEFVTNVPSDLAMFGKTVVAKKNLPKIGMLIGATAILVALDQPLLDAAQQFGRYIHLDAERKFTRA
ncbi:MAG: hypothetical protein GZ094_24815, partial [Mariniphaga sp.]|nr:hypothetical protein [Mariniphaga sp.]